MKRLANYLLAGAFRTNEGSEKVMEAMPAGREATAALFLECLLESVNKRNPSARIGEMIYKAMMEFIPGMANDCKSALFEADKKSRSPATHHEDDDKDDEDVTQHYYPTSRLNYLRTTTTSCCCYKPRTNTHNFTPNSNTRATSSSSDY